MIMGDEGGGGVKKGGMGGMGGMWCAFRSLRY